MIGCASAVLINAIFQERLVDVDGHHFAQHEPATDLVALGVSELHDVDHLAFHGRAAFAHPRDVDLATRHGREAGERKLVLAVRQRC